MTDPRRPPRPTEAEMQILKALWRLGPATVREVHEALHPEGSRVRTTTLKLLQIMRDKGLVERDESRRAHVYRPAADEGEVQRRVAGDLVERVFGGSAAKLVMRALTPENVSETELEEIRRMLDALEGEAEADENARVTGGPDIGNRGGAG